MNIAINSVPRYYVALEVRDRQPGGKSGRELK